MNDALCKYYVTITQASREDAAITITELRELGYAVEDGVGMGGFEMPYFILVRCVNKQEQTNNIQSLSADYDCGDLTLGAFPNE